jgi:hypothetical protein
MPAVTGSSGSGKTTLLSVLGGLLTPDAGSVAYDGQPVGTGTGEPRPGTAFVLQTYGLVPSLTAEENVAITLRARKVAPAEASRHALAALDRVAVGDLAERLIQELSVASCSGSPWPGLWPSSRTCCSPTSRPASSTRETATWSWVSCVPRPSVVLLGLGSAYLSLRLVLRSMSLGNADAHEPAPFYPTHWSILGITGLVLFVLAVLIALVVSRRITRLGRPSTLRWAEIG